MTNEEAREIMSKVIFYWELGEQTLTQNQINEAIDLAIKALENIEKIKAIIRTPENFLEQDVYRYKMICEVIQNDE